MAISLFCDFVVFVSLMVNGALPYTAITSGALEINVEMEVVGFVRPITIASVARATAVTVIATLLYCVTIQGDTAILVMDLMAMAKASMLVVGIEFALIPSVLAGAMLLANTLVQAIVLGLTVMLMITVTFVIMSVTEVVCAFTPTITGAVAGFVMVAATAFATSMARGVTVAGGAILTAEIPALAIPLLSVRRRVTGCFAHSATAFLGLHLVEYHVCGCPVGHVSFMEETHKVHDIVHRRVSEIVVS